MSRTLVIGGVRSGKSRHAESLLRDASQLTYVATGAPAGPDDPDWAARVAEHRARRPAHWVTVETLDLAGTLTSASGPLLIDCLGVWLARCVDDLGWDDLDRVRAGLAERTAELLEAWGACPVEVVAVTNEVGLGVLPSHASGRLFRDELGRLNTRLSATSERVHLVVAGRVLDLSAAPLVSE